MSHKVKGFGPTRAAGERKVSAHTGLSMSATFCGNANVELSILCASTDRLDSDYLAGRLMALRISCQRNELSVTIQEPVA